MEDRDVQHSFQGVHHILLSVPEGKKAEAHRFYEEDLGFRPLSVAPEIGNGDDLWWYDCGAAQVHVAIEPGHRPHQRAHPAILVRHLEVLGARLNDVGVETRWDTHYPGLKRFYIRDPFGNRLEFAEPIER